MAGYVSTRLLRLGGHQLREFVDSIRRADDTSMFDSLDQTCENALDDTRLDEFYFHSNHLYIHIKI